MLIEADLNEVKDYPTLDSGIYDAVVLEEPKLIQSREKKTPGLEFTLTLTTPGTEVAPGVARTFRHTVWKSEKHGWQHIGMKEVCEAMGVSMTNPDTAEFVNVPFKVAITGEPYIDKRTSESRVRNKVEYLLVKTD